MTSPLDFILAPDLEFLPEPEPVLLPFTPFTRPDRRSALRRALDNHPGITELILDDATVRTAIKGGGDPVTIHAAVEHWASKRGYDLGGQAELLARMPPPSDVGEDTLEQRARALAISPPSPEVPHDGDTSDWLRATEFARTWADYLGRSPTSVLSHFAGSPSWFDIRRALSGSLHHDWEHEVLAMPINARLRRLRPDLIDDVPDRRTITDRIFKGVLRSFNPPEIIAAINRVPHCKTFFIPDRIKAFRPFVGDCVDGWPTPFEPFELQVDGTAYTVQALTSSADVLHALPAAHTNFLPGTLPIAALDHLIGAHTGVVRDPTTDEAVAHFTLYLETDDSGLRVGCLEHVIPPSSRISIAVHEALATHFASAIPPPEAAPDPVRARRLMAALDFDTPELAEAYWHLIEPVWPSMEDRDSGDPRRYITRIDREIDRVLATRVPTGVIA